MAWLAKAMKIVLERNKIIIIIIDYRLSRYLKVHNYIKLCKTFCDVTEVRKWSRIFCEPIDIRYQRVCFFLNKACQLFFGICLKIHTFIIFHSH